VDVVNSDPFFPIAHIANERDTIKASTSSLSSMPVGASTDPNAETMSYVSASVCNSGSTMLALTAEDASTDPPPIVLACSARVLQSTLGRHS
jgi:hypothetical protein